LEKERGVKARRREERGGIAPFIRQHRSRHSLKEVNQAQKIDAAGVIRILETRSEARAPEKNPNDGTPRRGQDQGEVASFHHKRETKRERRRQPSGTAIRVDGGRDSLNGKCREKSMMKGGSGVQKKEKVLCQTTQV